MSSEFDTFSNDGGYPEAIGGSATTLGYEHRLPFQRFDAFSILSLSDGSETTVDHLHPPYAGFGFHTYDIPVRNHDSIPASPDGYGFSLVESYFMMPQGNGTAYEVQHSGDIFSSDGRILPDPDDMQREVGFLLREWRRKNALLLDEKERKEKETRNQIIHKAEKCIRAFYEKRKISCETSKLQNREREKIFLANQEKFHANADKQYWKAISELIPHEIPIIEKRDEKEQEKKPSIAVIQGPKPGKPTELSRMLQILVRLKHTSPLHMKPAPAFVSAPAKDAIEDGAAFARKKQVQTVKAPE